MITRCPTGKKAYPSKETAEDILIELWQERHYSPESGPLNVYCCDECGAWHFTSKPPMNERLMQAINSGSIRMGREARRWENKWKGKK